MHFLPPQLPTILFALLTYVILAGCVSSYNYSLGGADWPDLCATVRRIFYIMILPF
jgi:hypothetical protein